MTFHSSGSKEPMASSQKPSQPPSTTTYAAKKAKSAEPTVTIKHYKTNTLMCFPARHITNDHSLRDRCASLFATMQTQHPDLIILPNQNATTDVNILQSVNIPTAEIDFSNYFSVTDPEEAYVKVHVWLQSSKPISHIKRSQRVWDHLTNYGIWLHQNDISSQDIIRLGWLYGISAKQDSKSAVLLKLNSILSAEAMEQIQLNARTITYAPDRKIKTRAFLIEIDRTARNTHQTEIFQKLHPTSSMALVPMNSGADRDNHIRQFFLDQNQLLHSHVSIRVDNLHGLDDPIFNEHGKTFTLKDTLMNQKHPTTEEPYFKKISQCNTNCLNFYVKKDNIDSAITVIEEFINYCETTLPLESRQQLFTHNCKPIIIGSEDAPQQLVSFFTAASKRPSSSISVNASVHSDVSPSSTPPLTNRQRYSDAVMKRTRSTTDNHSPTTGPTANSAIASSSVASNARIDSILHDAKASLAAAAADQKRLSVDLHNLGSNFVTLAEQFKQQTHQQQLQNDKYDRIFDLLLTTLNVDTSSLRTPPLSPTPTLPTASIPPTQPSPKFPYPNDPMTLDEAPPAPDVGAGQQ